MDRHLHLLLLAHRQYETEGHPVVDAFLRKVRDQREREQEQEILAREPSSMAAGDCRICGKKLALSAGLVAQATVCAACGGRKRQAKLERDDAASVAISKYRSSLLQLAGINSNQEQSMGDKLCSNGCGTWLRSNNTIGICTTCKKAGRAPAIGAAATPKAKRKVSTKKQFRALTTALDVDGDGLLEEFMGSWIDKVKGSVKVPGRSEYNLASES